MKLIATITAILFVGGCTTLKPVEMSPELLQQHISEGEVFEVGDYAKIVTTDGVIHKFKVTGVSADEILGKGVEVPISDIVAVETREFSGGKTTALAVGSAAILYIIAASVAAASLLSY
jgi:hypothetical protein